MSTNSLKFLAKATLVAASGAILFTTSIGVQADTTPTQVGNLLTIGAGNGIWMLSTVSGRVSYCGVAETNSGMPLGTCNLIGSTGASSAGYFAYTNGSSLYVINKQTGSVNVCTVIESISNNGKITPTGGCAAVSTLGSLQ